MRITERLAASAESYRPHPHPGKVIDNLQHFLPGDGILLVHIPTELQIVNPVSAVAAVMVTDVCKFDPDIDRRQSFTGLPRQRLQLFSEVENLHPGIKQTHLISPTGNTIRNR